MRVPLRWLAEWIDLPDSLEVLVDRLTAAGLEVEQILRTGPDLSALRVGLVRESRRHPDPEADSVPGQHGRERPRLRPLQRPFG